MDPTIKDFWYSLRYGKICWAWSNKSSYGKTVLYYDGWHWLFNIGKLRIEIY